MMRIQKETGPDQLHRLMKQALDNGTVSSVSEAITRFNGYKIAFHIAREQASDPVHQATLMTALTLAKRVFLGGVYLSGALDVPHLTELPFASRLKDAAKELGAIIEQPSDNIPVISIGGDQHVTACEFHIRTVVSGWRGGIVPAHSDAIAAGDKPMPLTAMLAAGLAINEAFLFVNGEMRAAGKRHVGLSLWNPAAKQDWLDGDETEPNLLFLPSALWLIGLGHLGQAYLWGLGLLPYAERGDLAIVLQDTDEITTSTHSTSILTHELMEGRYKTRAMADWCADRGFSTQIYERTFAADFMRQPDEPAIALCGIDNAIGRQALDKTGFELIVEAGLGRGHQNFRAIRLHVLPGSRPASDIWPKDQAPSTHLEMAAYSKLLEDGTLDQCGVTLLAGKAVGAPFVGAIAASLALSEILRLLHGGSVHQAIDLDLMSVEHRFAAKNAHDFTTFNPGYVSAK